MITVVGFLAAWMIMAVSLRVIAAPRCRTLASRGDRALEVEVMVMELEHRVPLAELTAQAERKAIAMHSPLAGDPHQAKVVANRPDPTWNGHAPEPPSPIEITAFGDRDRSFTHAPTTTNTTHYYTGCGGRERDPDSVMAGGGGRTGIIRFVPAYIRNPDSS